MVSLRRYDVLVDKPKKKISLEYDDLAPGVSEDEAVPAKQRPKQVVVGVFLVITGIILMPLPGPGWAITLYGLNLIKPDNFLVRWLRAKIPGIPEEGSIPKSYIALGAVLMVAGTVFSYFYGGKIWEWFIDLF